MNLIPAIILTNLYLLILGLSYLLVFRYIRKFQANRFFLVGGIVLSLILPWIHLNLPLFTSAPVMTTLWTAMPVDHAVTVPVTDAAAESSGNLPSLRTILLSIYLLVVILMLSGIIFQLAKQVIRNRKSPSFRYGKLRIVPVNYPSPVYSLFNTVYYPEPVDLDQTSTRMILDHERIHAVQLHSLDNLLITLVQIFVFYNPIVYIIGRQIKLNHEFIADEATSVSDKYFYSETLISHQFKVPGLILMHSFNQRSYIKKRLIMLTKNKQPHRAGWSYLLILPLIAGMILMSSWSTFAQDQAKKSKEEIAKMAVEKELTKAGFSKADIDEIKLRIDGKTCDKPGVEAEADEGAEIFQVVEVMPEFKGGGVDEFRNWVQTNVKYPAVAIKEKISGTVYVSFVVSKTGEVKTVTIVRSVSPSLDEAVVKAVKSAPAWKPGLQHGKPVNVSFNIPIKFLIN